MKQKSFLFIIAVAAIAVSLLAFSVGNAKRIGSGVTNVSIDGRSFLVKNPLLDSRSAIRQELARLGVDASENILNLEDLNNASTGKLMASGNTTLEKNPRVPEGFMVEHTLRMSGEDGTVELIIGKTKRGGGFAATHLKANRWTQAETAGGQGLPNIFRKTQGKETDIVCLDEKKGVFLLLRRLER